MHIQCTKALLTYWNPKIEEKNTDHDMYAWHAHIVKRSRKNLLVVMHDLSRFTLVFYGVKKNQLKELFPMITIAQMNSLTASGFTLDEIKPYFDMQPNHITFSQSKNRTLVARLNKAVEYADFLLSQDGYYEDSIEQIHASVFCNQLLVCENNYKVCYEPKDKFKSYLDLLNDH